MASGAATACSRVTTVIPSSGRVPACSRSIPQRSPMVPGPVNSGSPRGPGVRAVRTASSARYRNLPEHLSGTVISWKCSPGASFEGGDDDIDDRDHRSQPARGVAGQTMPPIEEVRPGLWSIPVPMPVSPLRYTLVYALVLPDGLALIDTGLDTDESWRALVDGIHVTGHDISEIRCRHHPPASRPFRAGPRLLEHTDFTLAMHSNDAKFMRFRSDSEIQREQDWATEQLARLGAPTDIPETGMQHFTRLPKGRTVDVELDDHAR